MSKDYAMQFERLLKTYFDVDRITYTTFWNDDYARNALYYTVCLLESENAEGDDRHILEEFLSQLSQTGYVDRYEVLIFLNHLKGLEVIEEEEE